MATLHLISHTHWDREWYRTFQEFRFQLVHLIDGLLVLLKADPDFRYFMLDGQTILLDDYLQIRPEKEEELRRFITEGRILIGPWHILPDEFLVSPEATIRNLLQGDRTARRFGKKMQVGYIPDPFGHIGQMPQILRGAGIDTACFRRGLADEPVELNWQAPDGSTVFLAYLRNGYDNAAGLPTAEPDQFVSEVKRLRDALAPHSIFALLSNSDGPAGAASFSSPNSNLPDLLLMHGTDHMEPPPDISDAIAYANAHLNSDRLVHSTLPAYLADVRKMIDGESVLTVIGELRQSKRHHLLPGVLSSRMWIKQRNQACETLLEAWVEPFTTWAELIKSDQALSYKEQAPISAGFINAAWRLLMECHPHDSICGCSIDQVHDEMRVRFDQVEQIGEEITRQSLGSLAASIDTSLDPDLAATNRILETAIIVFNPTPSTRTDAVTVHFEPPPGRAEFEIIDDQGQLVPYEQMHGGSQELVHMVLDRKGLQDAMSMIHDGRAANMVVRGLDWQRQGSKMFVQVIMSTSGEPDLAAWQRALHESERVFADDTLESYIVQARTPPGSKATFIAQQVPAFGYKTYWLRTIPASITSTLAAEKPNRTSGLLLSLTSRLEKIAGPVVSKVSSQVSDPRASSASPDYAEGVVKGQKPPYLIENEFFRVEASHSNGTLSLLDKRSGVFYHGLNKFVDGGDRGDEYNYCPPEDDRLVSLAIVDSIRVEHGPVQQAIDISLHMRLPRELSPDRASRSKKTVVVPIQTRVRLTRGVPRLDIQSIIDNQGSDGTALVRDHRLRVHFPTPFAVQEADYDGHFEIVQRKLGLPAFDQSWVEQPRPEKPQRLFTAICADSAGLALANIGLPEIEIFTNSKGNSEFALTLLRCVGWLSRDDFANRHGHAGPALATPGAQMPGKYVFEYSVIPFSPGTPIHQVSAQAAGFNAPLRAVPEPLHAGVLPASLSLIKAEPAEFVISSIKLAESGGGWIVRGYNLGASQLDARLIPWKPCAHVEKVNLLEQRLEALETAPDGSVSFAVRPHEIVTLKFA